MPLPWQKCNIDNNIDGADDNVVGPDDEVVEDEVDEALMFRQAKEQTLVAPAVAP